MWSTLHPQRHHFIANDRVPFVDARSLDISGQAEFEKIFVGTAVVGDSPRKTRISSGSDNLASRASVYQYRTVVLSIPEPGASARGSGNPHACV